MIGGHVRDDRDVVVHHADPSEEDPASSGFQHGDVGMLIEGDGCAGEARVVPFLHAAVVAVDAVGGREGDPLAGRHHDVGEEPRRGGLPVRAAHLDHRDVGIRYRGFGSGVGGSHLASELRDHPIGRAPEDERHRARDRAGQRLRRPPPAPREDDDHVSELGPRPSADPEPSGAGGGGDPPRQLDRDARGRSDALFASARARFDRADPCGVRDRDHLLVADAEPPGDVQRELDGRSREIQVRAFEHP